MKGVLSWLVYWALCAGARDFYPALAAKVSSEQYIFFLTAHYVILCGPISQQPGQAVVPGRLSLNKHLWLTIVFCKAEGGGVREESNLDPDVAVQRLIYSATFSPSVLHIPSKF